MAVTKTKAMLVDVARQLFAKTGVEGTTMNDIAIASKKGRRTLYTYFKNKEEIYLAVVESEFELLSDMMARVAAKQTSPERKIMELIFTRLDMVKEAVYRNGTLRADFFRDIWRVENARKQFDDKQVNLFQQVLEEGQQQGIFHVDDVHMAATLIHYCLKGIEVPYIKGLLGDNLDSSSKKRYVSRIVYGALQMHI